MAYCRKCGEIIDDEAVFCPKCGVQQMPFKTESPKDDGSILWAILGFLIPIAGLILWAAWHDDRPESAKMAGWGALLSVILSAVFAVVLFLWLGAFSIRFNV